MSSSTFANLKGAETWGNRNDSHSVKAFVTNNLRDMQGNSQIMAKWKEGGLGVDVRSL